MLELLVVIGIIGILSAILLKSVSGSSDSARAAKCLANMHDLANACHSYAVQNTSYGNAYPLAGSRENLTLNMSFTSGSGMTKQVSETPGWVSWTSMGAYANKPKESQYSSSWDISTYETSQEKRLYALTNGAIWKAIGGNASSYRCPLHEQCAKKNGCSPIWSYVMNGYFGYKKSGDSRSIKTLVNRDRLLLFAELPFNEANVNGPSISYGTSTGDKFDPTLQYDQEEIGFNHKVKRDWYAHVCFADGHTEKLKMPGNSRFQELTEWLCEATPITFDGTNYREVK